MNANLVIMIVAVVAIGCLAGVLTEWLKTRRKEAENAGQSLNDDQEKRINELEERIKTLERIATDPSERLKREISDL